MSFFSLWFETALLVLGLVTLLWLLSLVLKNTSIVDIFWGMGFMIIYWVAVAIQPVVPMLRVYLLGAILTVWGFRLSLYIMYRNWGKGEDFRYAKWREESGVTWWWQSYFKVFILQGALMWLISAPLLAVNIFTKTAEWSLLDFLGVTVWIFGFIFEAGGDWQLARFKADSANRGKLLTTGLWAFTRHPNYFGDAAQWWGFYLIALAAGAWWSIFSPLLMSFLLVRVSGVALLEKTLQTTKPGYEDYISRTSAFVPWFPTKAGK